MKSDNPASRLLALLEDGKRHKKEENCKNVWINILKVKNGDAELMCRLGMVMLLPQQILEIVKVEFPNQQEQLNHATRMLCHAFGQQNFGGKWENFITHIDGHTLSYLNIFAELLKTKVNTIMLDQSKLDLIREKLDNILKEKLNLIYLQK